MESAELLSYIRKLQAVAEVAKAQPVKSLLLLNALRALEDIETNIGEASEMKEYTVSEEYIRAAEGLRDFLGFLHSRYLDEIKDLDHLKKFDALRGTPVAIGERPDWKPWELQD